MFEIFEKSGNREQDDAQALRLLGALLKGAPKDLFFRLQGLSQASSFLNWYIDDINWVGFYLAKEATLHLGPFQGLPACTTIPFGTGVCGTVAQSGASLIVADVHEFPGHIACDGASVSELVVPLKQNGAVVGVLDIDSPVRGRFADSDALFCQQVADLIISMLW